MTLHEMKNPGPGLVNSRNRRPLKEIALYLDKSERTLKRWIRAGKLQAIREPGGRLYSSRAAADSCLQPVNDWETRMNSAIGSVQAVDKP